MTLAVCHSLKLIKVDRGAVLHATARARQPPEGRRRTGRLGESGGLPPALSRRGSREPSAEPPSLANLEAPRFLTPFLPCRSSPCRASPGRSWPGRRGGPCPCAPCAAGRCSRGPLPGRGESNRVLGRVSGRESGAESWSLAADPTRRPAMAASSSIARSRSTRGAAASAAMLSRSETWRLRASRAAWAGPSRSGGPGLVWSL